MSYTIIECPKCGGEMNSRSKMCKTCVVKNRKSGKAWTDTCPGCGGPKTKVSKRCRACSYAQRARTSKPRKPGVIHDLKAVPPEWWYWFCGLFMGEGSVGIYHSQGSLPRLSLTMSLRDDDRAVLENMYAMIGGILYQRPKTNILQWSMNGIKRGLPVLMYLREYCIVPAKKLESVDLGIAYCEWRIARPYHLTPAERDFAYSFTDRLKALHSYSP